TPEMLAAQVQAGKDQPTTVLILREGKSTKIDITAGTRVVETSSAKGLNDALRVFSVRNRALGQLVANERMKSAQKLVVPLNKETDLARQLEDLQQQVQSLRATIDRMSESLKAGPTTPKK